MHEEGTGSDHYEWNMNIGDRSSGVYYLAIRAGDKVEMIRVVKI